MSNTASHLVKAHKKLSLGTTAAMTFAAVISLLAPQAWAVYSLGDVVCNVSRNLESFPPILSATCYVIAAILMVIGFYRLMQRADKEDTSKTVGGISYLIVSACFFALPAFTAVLQKTVFSSIASGGAAGCTAAAPGTATGLDQMLLNFLGNIYDPMITIISAISFVMGAFFIAKGLSRAAKTGTDPKAAAPTGVIAHLIVGTILMSLSTMVGVFFYSLFDFKEVAGFPGINWSGITAENTEKIDAVIIGILRFIQIFGAISFVRGWLIVKNAVEGSGQATIAQGITHVIGGAMAMNIAFMLKLIDNTMGSGLVK